MSSNKRTNRHNSGKVVQGKMARDLDALAEMDEFYNLIAPKLRKMLAEGKDAAAMYQEFQSLVAARVITEALQSKDAKTMLSAAKEILDRGTGKAKETIEVNNRYEQMSEEDLQKLIAQEEQKIDELPH